MLSSSIKQDVHFVLFWTYQFNAPTSQGWWSLWDFNTMTFAPNTGVSTRWWLPNRMKYASWIPLLAINYPCLKCLRLSDIIVTIHTRCTHAKREWSVAVWNINGTIQTADASELTNLCYSWMISSGYNNHWFNFYGRIWIIW